MTKNIEKTLFIGEINRKSSKKPSFLTLFRPFFTPIFSAMKSYKNYKEQIYIKYIRIPKNSTKTSFFSLHKANQNERSLGLLKWWVGLANFTL